MFLIFLRKLVSPKNVFFYCCGVIFNLFSDETKLCKFVLIFLLLISYVNFMVQKNFKFSYEESNGVGGSLESDGSM